MFRSVRREPEPEATLLLTSKQGGRQVMQDSSQVPDYLAGLEPEEGPSTRVTTLPLWQMLVGGCMLVVVAVLVLDHELEVPTSRRQQGIPHQALLRQYLNSALGQSLQKPLTAAAHGRPHGAGFRAPDRGQRSKTKAPVHPGAQPGSGQDTQIEGGHPSSTASAAAAAADSGLGTVEVDGGSIGGPPEPVLAEEGVPQPFAHSPLSLAASTPAGQLPSSTGGPAGQPTRSSTIASAPTSSSAVSPASERLGGPVGPTMASGDSGSSAGVVPVAQEASDSGKSSAAASVPASAPGGDVRSGDSGDPSEAGKARRPAAKAVPEVSTDSQLRIRVVPSMMCQAVTRKLEAHCEAGGRAASKEEPACMAAYDGNYQASYMAPFVQIAGAMRRHGFPFYQVEARLPGMNTSEELTAGDWTSDVLSNADVIIVGEVEAHFIMRAEADKRFVVLQAPSHASLSESDEHYGTCARTLLADERVIAYLQHTALSPLEVNNLPRISKSVHYSVLNQTYQGHQNPHELLHSAAATSETLFTSAMLAKVATLIPLVWRWRHPVTCHGSPAHLEWMQPSLDVAPGSFPAWLPPLSERTVDVAFTGAREPGIWMEDHAAADLYRQHRGSLIAVLERFKAAHPELKVEMPERMQYPDFAQLLRRSKLFISPWGFGEYSGKDLEAVTSRAVMVKPLASMFTSYPPIYQPNSTCLEVAVDFSDLEAVLLTGLADLRRSQEIADRAYQLLVEHSRMETVARDLAALLKRVAT